MQIKKILVSVILCWDEDSMEAGSVQPKGVVIKDIDGWLGVVCPRSSACLGRSLCGYANDWLE